MWSTITSPPATASDPSGATIPTPGRRPSTTSIPGTKDEPAITQTRSSGFAPRYWEENVRQMFTSSAAALIDDFHIDGVRVDLTGAIHQDNSLNVPGGRSVPEANL